MDPASLVPAVDAIPVHWLWFKILSLFTFILHILFMNVLLGGSLLAFMGHVGQKSEPWPAADFSKRLPVVSAMTINLGVPPLLFLQVLYGNYIYVSSVLSAVYWLCVIAFLMAAYYGLYIYCYKYNSLGGARVILTGVISLLLLLIAFFFVNNMTLMLQPKNWLEYFQNPFGSIINWADASLIPRYLHFVVASVAIAGLFSALVATFKFRKGDPAAQNRISQSMQYFSWATVVQAGLGLWLLISLPEEVMLQFLGRNGFATILLGLVLVTLAGALVFGFKESPVPAAVFAVLTVVFMAMIRDEVRDAYLAPYHSLEALPVTGQSGSLILFLVTFVIGLGVIGYMFKIYFSAKRVD